MLSEHQGARTNSGSILIKTKHCNNCESGFPLTIHCEDNFLFNCVCRPNAKDIRYHNIFTDGDYDCNIKRTKDKGIFKIGIHIRLIFKEGSWLIELFLSKAHIWDLRRIRRQLFSSYVKGNL